MGKYGYSKSMEMKVVKVEHSITISEFLDSTILKEAINMVPDNLPIKEISEIEDDYYNRITIVFLEERKEG